MTTSSKTLHLRTRHNVDGTKGTLVLVRLAPDTDYLVSVDGKRRTSGSWRADLFLAGDVDGDNQVTSDDVDAVRDAFGAKRGSSRYVQAADIDHSGRVGFLDLLFAKSNVGASVTEDEPEPNPLDEFLPDNAVTVTGVDPLGLNDALADFTFEISSTRFTQNPADTTVTVNDEPVPTDRVTITPTQITVADALVDGRNVITLATFDTEGRNVTHQFSVWAGDNDLQVLLVDASGTPFTSPAQVTLALVDDQSIAQTQPASNGTASFTDVPSSTVVATAVAAGNVTGFAGGIGIAGQLTVRMTGFGTPSTVANNDFSQGTAGWDIGSAPVTIVEHDENVGPGSGPPMPGALRTQQDRASADEAAADTASSRQVSPGAGRANIGLAQITDQDLAVSTAGEGEQSISRMFATDVDVVAVRVRYRFVTSEVPGGYFGSEFNDYFRVSLRSQQGGGQASEANSMNGLGLGALDGAGSTAWRDVTLPTNVDGDTIQVDIAVANVADGLLDSQVYVDFVEEIRVRVIPQLSWNNQLCGIDLRYEVEGAELPEARSIEATFGNGTGYANRVGGVLFTHDVPAQTRLVGSGTGAVTQ